MTNPLSSPRPTRRTRVCEAGAVVLLLAAGCAVLHLGPAKIATLFSTGHLPSLDELLIGRFRLPRLLMGLMVGSGMAISGWAAQKVTGNPLASPDILTVPAAAAFGVMLVVWLSGGKMLASHTLPLAAAGAGIAAAVLLFTLVGRKRHLDGSGFLLVGIALGCLLSAATFLIALNAGAGMDMHGFTVNWMSGQLSRASWDYVWLLLPGWWLLSLAVVLSARWIDVLRFEDDVVTQLGGRANRWRRLGLCLSAALCAVCVGVGGGFGFIGFVTPHLVRVATRQASDSPWAVACLGAILLLTADAVGQYIMWPDQIPAGIVVAMLGTPCFILFMFRRKLVRNG